MTQQMVVFLARRALMTALITIGPVLFTAIVVGVVVAIAQAVTSIREVTLTMIAKILVVGGVTFWLLPWMLNVIVAYTSNTLRWVSYLGS